MSSTQISLILSIQIVVIWRFTFYFTFTQPHKFYHTCYSRWILRIYYVSFVNFWQIYFQFDFYCFKWNQKELNSPLEIKIKTSSKWNASGGQTWMKWRDRTSTHTHTHTRKPFVLANVNFTVVAWSPKAKSHILATFMRFIWVLNKLSFFSRKNHSVFASIEKIIWESTELNLETNWMCVCMCDGDIADASNAALCYVHLSELRIKGQPNDGNKVLLVVTEIKMLLTTYD